MTNEKNLKANDEQQELLKKAVNEKIVEKFDKIENIEDIRTAGHYLHDMGV